MFAFYSTEAPPTTTPNSLSPAPITLVTLDQDPLFGEYDPTIGTSGRGSQTQTMGGVVIQDFGVCLQDGRIKIADSNALRKPTVDRLKAVSAIAGAEYFFTDGYEVWKVAFLRPGGFRAWRNMLFAAHGEEIFSYEINLIVLEEMVQQDFGMFLSAQ